MIMQIIGNLLGKDQRQTVHDINNHFTKDWLLIQVRARKLAKDSQELSAEINSTVERFVKMRNVRMRKKK